MMGIDISKLIVTVLNSMPIFKNNKKTSANRSHLVAYLLWFFVGYFGASRFYTRNYASGAVMLLTSLITIIPNLISAHLLSYIDLQSANTYFLHVSFSSMIMLLVWWAIDGWLTHHNVTRTNKISTLIVPPKKSMLVAYFCWLFFWGYGASRIYTRRYKTAAIIIALNLAQAYLIIPKQIIYKVCFLDDLGHNIHHISWFKPFYWNYEFTHDYISWLCWLISIVLAVWKWIDLVLTYTEPIQSIVYIASYMS